MGVFFDQQKRGLVVLGGKKVKKERRSDRRWSETSDKVTDFSSPVPILLYSEVYV